jgi:hypothetical protein
VARAVRQKVARHFWFGSELGHSAVSVQCLVCPKADMAENCAAASRPGSARAHASDNNSGKSFRINIDLGCGLSPAYGPAHGTGSALILRRRGVAQVVYPCTKNAPVC